MMNTSPIVNALSLGGRPVGGVGDAGERTTEAQSTQSYEHRGLREGVKRLPRLGGPLSAAGRRGEVRRTLRRAKPQSRQKLGRSAGVGDIQTVGIGAGRPAQHRVAAIVGDTPTSWRLGGLAREKQRRDDHRPLEEPIAHPPGQVAQSRQGVPRGRRPPEDRSEASDRETKHAGAAAGQSGVGGAEPQRAARRPLPPPLRVAAAAFTHHQPLCVQSSVPSVALCSYHGLVERRLSPVVPKPMPLPAVSRRSPFATNGTPSPAFETPATLSSLETRR
jgi:hypothetical protein